MEEGAGVGAEVATGGGLVCVVRVVEGGGGVVRAGGVVRGTVVRGDGGGEEPVVLEVEEVVGGEVGVAGGYNMYCEV